MLRGAPQPEILALALRCRRYNTLPHSGGLLDQPPGLIDAISVALNVYDAINIHKERGVDAPREALEIVKFAMEAMSRVV